MYLVLIFTILAVCSNSQPVAQYLVYCGGSIGILGTNMIASMWEWSDAGSTHNCYCPYGTYDAGQSRCYLSSAIAGCMRGTGTTDLNLVCNYCGYGLTLTSNTTCTCTNYNITGGCSNDVACNRIVYTAFNQSACVSCKPTFTLINGVCVCPVGDSFDNTTNLCYAVNGSSAPVVTPTTTTTTNITGCITALNATYCSVCGYSLSVVNGSCVCLGQNVTGGCTSIQGCTYITFPSATSSKCISCALTFTLDLSGNLCVCAGGTFYNTSTSQCQTPSTATNTTNTTTSIPGCLQAVNATACAVCGYGLGVANGSCVCLGQNVTGGCTSIQACAYITYPTPTTAVCISCASTFTLLSSGFCVCAAGSYFNTSLNQCQTPVAANSGATNLAAVSSSSQSSSNGAWLETNQMMVLITVMGIVLVAIAVGLVYLLYKSCGKDPKVDPQRVFTQSDLKNASSIDIKSFPDSYIDAQMKPKKERPTRTRKARKTMDELQSGYQMDEVHLQQEVVHK